jgi:hypothetical protein
MGLPGVRQFALSTPAGEATLTLTPAAADPARVAVAPWPFRADHVTLIGEGRRLPATFTDEAAMQTALAAAPWVTLIIHLHPA